MKHLLISAIAVLAAFSGAAVDDVKWLETSHNFGAFDEDLGPVTCTFKFVNTLDEPVSIVVARSSCGCTSPVYSRDAVEPGDTASISVTYDPAGRPGRFTKYVGVQLSAGPAQPKLYIKGTVVGSAKSVARRFPVDCGADMQLAKGVLMTGEVAKGQLRTVFLEAYNRSTDTIRPRIEGLPPYLEAVASPEAVPPGEQMSFIFYFHSARCEQYGLVCDTVYVCRDADSAVRCPLPTVAIVSEDFSKMTAKQLAKAPHCRLSETSLDFGRLGREPVSMECTVRNTGKSPLKLRRVYTADEGVAVSVSADTVKPGKEAVLTVTVDPRKLPGALLNARISIVTNDPDAPNTTLRAVGEL